MEKKVIRIISIFVLMIFFVILSNIFFDYSISGQVINEKKIDKLDEKIFERFNSNDPIKVIVTLEEEIKENFFTSAKKIPVSRKDFINEVKIKDRVKHNYIFSNSFSAELTKEEIEELSKDIRVKRISYDYPVRILLQDSTPLINATKTWGLRFEGINLTGKHQTVCIIDTGIDYTHPDLGSCLGNNCKVLGGYDFVNSDTDPSDDNGHGTHVGGIVAANNSIRGVSPDANLIAIKSLDNLGIGDFSDVVAGIEWCVNNATSFNITVISMSLGTEVLFNDYCDDVLGFESIRNSINAAIAKNISVVVATGNDNNKTHISSPACIKNATRITSSTKSDLMSSFSNRNELVNLIAPGSSINSTKAYGTSMVGCSDSGNYRICSGTSMATPHVAGAIAIIKQYLDITNKTKNPKQIEEILNNTGRLIYDSESNKNYSRIDIYNAILFLDESPKIQFASPTDENSSLLGRSYIQINITTEDINLDKIKVRLYNSSNILIKENISSEKNFFINYTGLLEGVYYFNATANDTNGNQNSTETRIINLTKPISNIILPKNKTYITNESLLLNFTALAKDFLWYNIYNGLTGENVTGNLTIMQNTTFNTPSNGFFTLNLYANNTFGEVRESVNFTVNSSLFSIFYLTFNASTTDFKRKSFEELQNLSGATFEREGLGKIRFKEGINLTNLNGSQIDFDSSINISYNRIEIDTETLPNLNKSATLYLYNLTFSNPRILKDGKVCPSEICIKESYSLGILIFNVTQFSVYEAEETPFTSPSSGGSGGGGGAFRIITSNVSNDSTSRDLTINKGENETGIEAENGTNEEIINEKAGENKGIYKLLIILIIILISLIILTLFGVKKKKHGKG